MSIGDEKAMELIGKLGTLTGRIDEYIKAHTNEHERIDLFIGDQRKMNEKTIKLWSGIIVVIGFLNFISTSIAIYVVLH